jgi:tetratricopeptide (TPR) repeat protein
MRTVRVSASTLRPLTLALALVVSAAFASPAAAEDETTAERQARTYFATGDYKQALEIYARLYVETMHPTYLRNIGRCQQNMGEADKAISTFREYLRKAKNLTPDQRAEIDGYIAEMEQLKRSQSQSQSTITVVPPPATPPPSASPPPLVDQPAVVASRSPAPESDAAPFYTRTWFWVGAAALVAGSVTAVFLLTPDTSPTHGNLGVVDARGDF